MSFRTKNGTPLNSELKKLGDILEKSVRYLPMTITVQSSQADSDQKRNRCDIRSINSDRLNKNERFRKRYAFTLGKAEYLIVVSIGTPVHEVYQNNVLVTDRYNLLSHDLKSGENAISVPHLQINV